MNLTVPSSSVQHLCNSEISVILSSKCRFVSYSLLPTPSFLTYPIDCLHSVTYGLMWATGASYASAVAPRGAEATLQALVGALYYNAGKGNRRSVCPSVTCCL